MKNVFCNHIVFIISNHDIFVRERFHENVMVFIEESVKMETCTKKGKAGVKNDTEEINDKKH